MSKEMERLKEIEARKAELTAEINAETTPTEERLSAIKKEASALAAEETELRSKIQLQNDLKPGAVLEDHTVERGKMGDLEKRAKNFVATNKLECRAVLSTGHIAKPTSAGGINDLAETESGIVDDVNAIALTGNGAWVVGYKKTEATAADVTDGNAVGGTGAEFDTVEINPSEWGVLDTISNQVKKMTALDYTSAVEKSALTALRVKASVKIVAAVKASDLAEKVTVPLNQDYLRTLVLGFHATAGKGNVALYLSQADLLTLGKVRGTSEKKALYEIKFDEGSTTSGIISEGGLAARFRVLDELTEGTQLFGQPGAIDMPMWDNYEISTDAGGKYFENNLLAVRGLQTAGADLVVWHGMQVVKQAAQG